MTDGGSVHGPRPRHTILVVEDQELLRKVLATSLAAAGYRIVEASTVARAILDARAARPDLAIVDLGLPDGDGLDLIRDVRRWSMLPVIVLSARRQEADKVAALDAGADDFVTKPFGSEELLARIRAALRRAPSDGEHPPRLRFGNRHVDLARREATDGSGGTLALTPLEFRLLDALARRIGLVVPRRQLIREVWGPGRGDESGGLRVCVKGLRDKLEPDPARPQYLRTELGVGYRLSDAALDEPQETDLTPP